MAQVKVQTSAPQTGPGLSSGGPLAAMACPGSLGLQPSVNGTALSPTPACPAPAAGYGDAPVSATLPGSPAENMANPKEKTPMCLVNELARFNRLQPQYNLLNERGPAHAKIFTVQLTLGQQVWEAEGSSIKKAQHSTASKALQESVLPRPMPRSPKVDINSNPGSITPTVELNGLAMKRGEPAIYRPLDPKPMPNYRACYNFRGMYNQRYHYPIPKIFYVQLSVGSHEFIGEGRTRQAARHNAAMKALQALRNEPIPDRPPQDPEVKVANDEGTDASKSEISLVYEIALKRNLTVNFEVFKESGPPHMKSFLTRVTVGEFSAEGEGNSKKLSKKRAAVSILQDLKKLPFIPVVEKPKSHYKKRTKTILKVKVNTEVATGTGPNKKVAKRNAAEAMLLKLGYKASTIPQNPTEMDNKGWNGQKASFTEATSNTQKGLLHLSPDVYQEMEASRKQGGCSPGSNGSSGGGYMASKEMGPCATPLPPGHTPYFSSPSPTPSPTATMARELLLNGQSPMADVTLPGKGKSAPLACGVSVQPAQQLEYLARIQGFQVQYSDAQSGKDFVTYLTLSPVQMAFHGTGSTLQASHDQAALSALKQLSEKGLDPVDGPVKSTEACGRNDGH
ncbi:double-stranded RNA-binding protein Staufen homolog 2 isoform X2 [Phyllopteryx taeniolatus]|uniref:double-stranded RNA-binding protein Staufen homolog 2 isoform X2 n=1 Tax=Phyllopteryx taeniolatus TaxID=161469 RepID=UPI002AD5556F|nr:double-stranded RNA-binding protein Staufen homolog 2 isoform X2 [Phyllopteryx taeniolatus]